jgi:DNA-binding NtrC family response regulator
VLVVEHSAAIRRLFEVVLRDVAGQIYSAADNSTARLVLEHESIDVVVLDPQCDDEFSWSLLDELVAAEIPTVVVTSRAEEDVVAEATRRRAAAVFTKPFRSTDLTAVIARL